jgi:hypothetical protein
MTKHEDIDALIQSLEQLKSFASTHLKKLQSCQLPHGNFDYAALVRQLDSISTTLPVQEELSAVLQQAQEIATQHARLAFLELESDIKELCERHQWHLDGHWPHFHIERSIEVVVSETKHTVTIDGTKLRGCGIDAIEQSITPIADALFPKPYDRNVFVELLAQSFDACTHRSDERVSIHDLYKQAVLQSQSKTFWRRGVAKDFSELTITQFRARLSTVLDGNSTDARGRALHVTPPIHTKDGLFLYLGAEDRMAYVGSLAFIR